VREKITRYAEDQIAMMEKQKARAIAQAKAREIARCMRIGQLQRLLRCARAFEVSR